MNTGPAADLPVERHPWQPFIPSDPKILILGTFPPQQKRWAMDFYYPNPTNDFWKITGLLFLGDPGALYDRASRSYRLDRIRELLENKGIALSDSARTVQRLASNASDKYLRIVEPVDLSGLIAQMPHLRAIATTGQKAASVIADITGTGVPPVAVPVPWNGINIWRMPSTSRAYPLSPEKKAEAYRILYTHTGLL